MTENFQDLYFEFYAVFHIQLFAQRNELNDLKSIARYVSEISSYF